MTKKVANDDADGLGRPFTAKEVRRAVFQMGAFKSPSPDGVPGIFYQKCWYFIKKDVTKAILSVLNSGVVLTELNRTFITLVPKSDNPEKMGDYRPFSLCNVFMHIVSKCISNRLTKVMPYLVGDFQNAFIRGRHISDNILLANEAIHKINSHKKGKNGRFAFKADMSKAYDRVKWGFLMAVLEKLGFPDKLARRPTFTFSVCFMYRGLVMYHGAIQNMGVVKGISLCQGEENLSHLFFTDDAVFFLQDQDDSASKLTCISSWNGIFLPPAGRLTLISSVLSNLSNYFLSVFKIPVSVTRKLNALLSQFWWAGCKEVKTIHCCSKKFLSLPKSEGGLRICNIECLNHAMLAKHAWKMVSGNASLFCRVFRRNFIDIDNWSLNVGARNGNNLSWGARSILYGLEFVQQHMAWKPGLSSSMNVWITRWVNGEYPEPRNDLFSLVFFGLSNIAIRALRNSVGTAEELSWHEDFVRQLFSEESANGILALPICRSRNMDEVYWTHTNKGEYSVKSGYGVL
ncbi:uncharacterized protein LOC141590318 [Silene latifolia]|uniref:uncharacterized protein LOC141590318 n=1 Tax=Silene latifolia TaxID=37657 RepID=UPI003D7782FE